MDTQCFKILLGGYTGKKVGAIAWFMGTGHKREEDPQNPEEGKPSNLEEGGPQIPEMGGPQTSEDREVIIKGFFKKKVKVFKRPRKGFWACREDEQE